MIFKQDLSLVLLQYLNTPVDNKYRLNKQKWIDLLLYTNKQ